MALRNQPYLPLYVKDFRNDEKLARCSAASHGVYILLLCILHSEAEYGKVLLRQKERQNSSSIKNFADVFVRMMPFSVDEIESALTELSEMDVIQVDGNVLSQKRMVRDGIISDIRASAGKKGSDTTNKRYDFAAANASAKAASKASAKASANSVNEYVNVSEDDTKKRSTKFVKPTVEQIQAYCKERNNNIDAQYFFDRYETNGWMVGKTPMKNWQASVRTWEKKDGERRPSQFTPEQKKQPKPRTFVLTEDGGLKYDDEP